MEEGHERRSAPRGDDRAQGRRPVGQGGKATDVPVFAATAMPRLDNERVTVWEYSAPAGAADRHRHPRDTVVVFTSEKTARAMFIPAGTVHSADETKSGPKVTVFELK